MDQSRNGQLTSLLIRVASALACVSAAACLQILHAARPPANVHKPAGDPSGLINRWQFNRDHVDGNTVKAIAGRVDAKIVGPVRFESEEPGALIFDGDSAKRHHVAITTDIKSVALPKREITVDVWVRIDKRIAWGGLCGVLQDNGEYERGWQLGYHDQQFYFAVATAKTNKLTYLMSSSEFELGYWYHVAGMYDGREQRIYVDGRLRGKSTTQAGDIAYPPKAFYTIGAYHDDNSLYAMSGQIERVSVYDRAATSDEIVSRFDARKKRFPGIEVVRPEVADWPTYLRDNQRTGITAESLQFPLELKWLHKTRHTPKPAWPEPAKQNFWAKKFNLKARVTFDRAFHVVSIGNRVYFGSSADDKLYCLDATTGQERWSFFAEGPVRLAPTIADGRVLFGSDDGHVYCLNASDGRLVWKFRIGPSDRRIPGNERVSSAWPVRTGILVEGNIAYFCAGVFPVQGVYQVAVDIRTGKKLASGSLSVTAQGYLERRSGKLFVKTGRSPAGAFVSQLGRRGKSIGKEVRAIPDDFPYAFVGAGDARIGGGDGKVAAFGVNDGSQLWSASVMGKAYSLAIARGRLLVSTDQGFVYCFAPADSVASSALPKPQATENISVVPSPTQAFPYNDPTTQQRCADAAVKIVERSGIRRGYCLVLGSGRGELVYELAQRTDLQIIGVESNATDVAASRRALDAAGLYGRAVIHQTAADQKLPYTDYVFNLVVDGSLGGGAGMPDARDEANRVLRPNGGVAIFGTSEDAIVRRGPLDGIGDWTHMYADAANTVCSSDQRVGGKLQLQWFGRPGPRQMVDRHNRTVAPLCKSGRIFISGNERIIAADAYNGTPLWNIGLPHSRRVGAYRDCSNMVATDDVLYVAAEDSCHGFDSETGESRLSFPVPRVDEAHVNRHWGFLANVGPTLFGSATKPNASRHTHSKATIDEVYYDFGKIVCSDYLFAMDRHSGRLNWTYGPSAGLILNPTITIGGGKVFFVESDNKSTLDIPDGRAKLADLVGQGSHLIALDMQTGKLAWRKEFDFSNIQHNLYVSYAKGVLAIAGSRNNGTDKKRSRVLFDLRVVDAATGQQKWFKTQQQSTAIGGSHGEQDYHHVIIGDKLYCEPFAYDLMTGKPVTGWAWANRHRRGCGTVAASASTFFFRDNTLTIFDVVSNKYTKLTTTTRPGCWINMIPAGGLLLVPEASSGCTCDFAVQTSLAFLPVRDESK